MMSYLTMKEFGRWGRFANCCFQYAFLTGYAQRYGAKLQLPPWVGCELFGLRNDPVTVELPPFLESTNSLTQASPPVGDEVIDHDWRGYAQYHASYYRPDRDRIRGLFTPQLPIRDRLAAPLAKMRARGPVVGLHLRRGDYGQSIFPIIPTSWYLRWLDGYYDWVGAGGLFVATESPELVADFARYDPMTVESLGVDLVASPMANCTYLARDLQTADPRALDFYPDFYLLSHCDCILAPSSTFSFMAAMLNRNLKQFWRADLDAADFVLTDPWDSYPLLHQDVRQYPHLEGIRLQSNPYWAR